MTADRELGVLPVGVQVAPAAARALEKALDCLGRGLLVGAWSWTEKARLELDKLTDGQGVDDNLSTGVDILPSSERQVEGVDGDQVNSGTS